MTDQNGGPAEGGGEPDDAAPTEETLRAVCADLLEHWDAAYTGAGSVTLGHEDQELDPVRFGVVLAFASHTHHVTGTACHLMADGDYPSAIPLLRLAYESALTATWASLSSEAGRGLHNKYLGTIRNLRRDAAATGWFDDMLAIAAEDGTEPVDVAASAAGEAKNFENLCRSLEPFGPWLYTLYRLLSGYSHPSGTVLSLFIPGTLEDPVSIVPAAFSSTREWWHAAALNLLFAGQALDRLDRGSHRRQALARASEIAGWPEPLRLTTEAQRKVRDARENRDAP